MSYEFEFTEDMNEISGLGAEYERSCRAAVIAGSHWALDHPDAEPAIEGYTGGDGWVKPQNMAGTSLLAAIEAAAFTMDDGRKITLGELLTPNQYVLVLQHIGLIAQMGWNAYAEKMRGTVRCYEADSLDDFHAR